MKKYIFAIALFAVSMLISCSDSTDFTTKVLTESEIESTPGFSWFEVKVLIYKPNLTTIADIKSALKSKHNFYFFATPACSCDSLQNIFPNAVKSLQDAGLDANTYCKFVVMKNETADNPFKDNFKIDKLPEIFLVVDGLPVYSIGDTLRARKDTQVETVILEAIRANQ